MKKITDAGKSPRFEKIEVTVKEETDIVKFMLLMDISLIVVFVLMYNLFNSTVGLVSVLLVLAAFLFFFIFCRDDDGGGDGGFDFDDSEGGLPIDEEERGYLESVLSNL